ncbi:MAG: DUF3667 domain-containing protein [Bacteroidota bacterium]
MNTICKNCAFTFDGKYCNQCGQTGETHRLNFHFVWHDIQHGIFHVDKGILYSISQLFMRPGHTIREFIDGKRVKHFKPLSMVVILATIYGLMSHYFHVENPGPVRLTTGSTPSAEELSFYTKMLDWIETHYALTTLLALPFFAFGTFIAFKKQGYNFIEHMVLNAFLSAQRLTVHIALFPIMYAVSATHFSGPFNSLLRLTDLGLTIWVCSQFFSRLSKTRSVLLTLLAYVIYIITFVLFGGLVLTIIGATLYD